MLRQPQTEFERVWVRELIPVAIRFVIRCSKEFQFRMPYRCLLIVFAVLEADSSRVPVAQYVRHWQ